MDAQLNPGGVSHRLDRLGSEVDRVVLLLLPAIGPKSLLEVALRVEQPDPDERETEVADGLEVVPGEHAKSAGVVREAFREGKLEREIGDNLASGGPRHAYEALARAVALERFTNALHVVEEAVVPGQFGPSPGAGALQQLHRVVARTLPRIAIDSLEERHGIRVPGPEEVVRQRPQGLEGVRERRLHEERTSGPKSH